MYGEHGALLADLLPGAALQNAPLPALVPADDVLTDRPVPASFVGVLPPAVLLSWLPCKVTNHEG